MTNLESDLVVERLARNSRLAAVAGLIGILIFLSSVAYSFYSLRPLQAEVSNLNKQKTLLNRQIGDLTQEVKELDRRREIAVAARNYAVDSDPAQKIHTTQPDQPVLYFHITNEAQRARAKDISNALQSIGYIVPGIQKVSVDLTKTDIRYFHKEDADKAKEIGTALQKLGMTDLRPRLVTGYESKVAPGEYEVWFSNSF